MRRYWTQGLGRYLVGHPRSVVDVTRVAWRLRQNGWYRKPPFLPVPHQAYWDFRRTTALGSSPVALTPGDVVDAATWASLQRVRG